MDLGLYVDAFPGIGPLARRVEEAGFAQLWVYDSPLVFGDVYMALAEAALATERIRLAPGVTTALSRPPYATAQAIGTLAKAAHGRVELGVGIGNSARRSLGQPPARLAELHEHVRVVRGLLRGESVELDGYPIRFIHPDGRWLDLSHEIPIWISAFGPRGQRLAGADADGVLLRWEGAEAFAAARARIEAGARDAGREPDAIRLGVVYAVYPIEDERELEAEQARADLGPLVISRLRYLTANASSADEVPEPFRPGFAAYQEYRASLDRETAHLENYLGYLVFTPEHLEQFVTPDSMRTVALVGSPEEVAEELRAMDQAGVDQATLQMSGDSAAFCERMRERVVPLLEKEVVVDG